MTDLRQLSIIF